MITLVSRVAWGLLKLASLCKDVRDVSQGRPGKLVKRHLKSEFIRWIARR